MAIDADTLTLVAGMFSAPALAFIYYELYWHSAYGKKQLANMEQSATQTAETATVPGGTVPK